MKRFLSIAMLMCSIALQPAAAAEQPIKQPTPIVFQAASPGKVRVGAFMVEQTRPVSELAAGKPLGNIYDVLKVRVKSPGESGYDRNYRAAAGEPVIVTLRNGNNIHVSGSCTIDVRGFCFIEVDQNFLSRLPTNAALCAQTRSPLALQLNVPGFLRSGEHGACRQQILDLAVVVMARSGG